MVTGPINEIIQTECLPVPHTHMVTGPINEIIMTTNINIYIATSEAECIILL